MGHCTDDDGAQGSHGEGEHGPRGPADVPAQICSCVCISIITVSSVGVELYNNTQNLFMGTHSVKAPVSNLTQRGVNKPLLLVQMHSEVSCSALRMD